MPTRFAVTVLLGTVLTSADGRCAETGGTLGDYFIEANGQRYLHTVTQEDGLETHHISRVTLVNWKDVSGKSRWIQYVSLEGIHRHEPKPAIPN